MLINLKMELEYFQIPLVMDPTETSVKGRVPSSFVSVHRSFREEPGKLNPLSTFPVNIRHNCVEHGGTEFLQNI